MKDSLINESKANLTVGHNEHPVLTHPPWGTHTSLPGLSPAAHLLCHISQLCQPLECVLNQDWMAPGGTVTHPWVQIQPLALQGKLGLCRGAEQQL